MVELIFSSFLIESANVIKKELPDGSLHGQLMNVKKWPRSNRGRGTLFTNYMVYCLINFCTLTPFSPRNDI
jgi:hypothetical protein